MSVQTNYPLCFRGFRRKVWVAEQVLEVWESYRQTKAYLPESFGVIIGTTSINRCELWLDDVTTPMPYDVQCRSRFELKDPGHQRTVDKLFERSNGSEIYLGTWHTHPEQIPCPSRVDKSDWRACLKRNKDRPLIFVIAGIAETRMFRSLGRRFKPLEVVKELHVD